LKALAYLGGICTDRSFTILEDRGSFEYIKVNNLSSININHCIVDDKLEIGFCKNLILLTILINKIIKLTKNIFFVV